MILIKRTMYWHLKASLGGTLTIKPEQWGFDLPQSVDQIMQGQIPGDLSFRIDKK